jgi:hypothetical protein
LGPAGPHTTPRGGVEYIFYYHSHLLSSTLQVKLYRLFSETQETEGGSSYALLGALWHKFGAASAGEEKTLLGKPAVPPWRPVSLNGGGEYATVFPPKRTWRPSHNKWRNPYNLCANAGAACWAPTNRRSCLFVTVISGQTLRLRRSCWYAFSSERTIPVKDFG